LTNIPVTFQGEASADWTEQETLLLLEALEVYNDNWADIAEHVGTKSQVQCITHFLQLPIEDQFLDDMETSSLGVAAGVDGQPGSAQGIPFADAGNPIMAQVAFLTSMIGPRVAAAAASKALEVLAEEEPETAEEAANVAKASEAAGQAEPEAPVDRMDVDGEQGKVQPAYEGTFKRILQRFLFADSCHTVV
jgi:SWI/SNF related-matrix-associated actin-dependent regulator of chromatin subfamily C